MTKSKSVDTPILKSLKLFKDVVKELVEVYIINIYNHVDAVTFERLSTLQSIVTVLTDIYSVCYFNKILPEESCQALK